MNAQEIYKEATEQAPELSVSQLEEQRKQADLEQRNVEAWAQWCGLPQTEIFINKLKTVAIIIEKQTASFCANVPGVSNEYLRARLVEINLLHEIIDVTVKTGRLKENILKEYIS